MKRFLIVISVMFFSMVGRSQQTIHGSVKKSATPGKIEIWFQPNYNTVAGEYVNYFQIAVAIPAAGNSLVTATATGVGPLQDMGALVASGPYLETTSDGQELVFNFGFLNPSPPTPVNHYGWTSGVDFKGVEITFSTTSAAAEGKMVDLTNNDGGFGGANGNSLYGIVTNTGDKTDFSGLFYAIPCTSILGTYTNPGSGIPDQYVKTLNFNPGTVSGNSPICIGATATYSSDGDAGGTWTSTNTTVATVDVSTGIVTAITQGTTNITYTVCGNAAFKVLTVTGDPLPGTVSGPATLCNGATASFTTSGTAGGTWSSSNNAVATVNSTTGTVTATGAGTATITYTVTTCAGGTLSASKSVTVNANVNAGFVNGPVTLCIGATVTYSSNGDAGGTWSSSNTAVATINATSGQATTTGAGTTIISYTINSGCGAPASASQALVVNPNASAGTVSGASPLCIGADALYSSNGDGGGTWSSSNTAVATVNAVSGQVTAASPGTTNITYTVTNGCNAPLSSSASLTVRPNVNAGTVSGASPLCIGSTAMYSSNGDEGGTWSSSNTGVATVNATTGIVTATGAGTTTITYTIGSGCGAPASASATLIVSPNVSAGSISGTSPLCIGATASYSSNGNTGGTWSSSNAAVATVNASTGVVTATGAGTVTITYTITTGCGSPASASAALTVNANANAGLINGASSLCIGSNATYTSTGDAGGTWSSGNTLVATVDASSGQVTAVAAGTVTITYTVTAGCNAPVSASKTITVNANVSAGTVSGASPLCIGATATYSATGASASGSWSSSNAAVATVNANSGVVTATGAGTTTITYTINSGCGAPASASAALTVNANASAGTVNGASPLCIGSNDTYTSTGDAGGTWSSSNTLVATVDASSGQVTAVAAGTVTITYTVTAGCNAPVSASKTLTVNPNVNPGTVSGNSPICTNTTALYSTNGEAGGTWSSSDPSVASVNATSGLVSALAVGTTDITYTISSGCGSPASASKNLAVIPTVTAGTVSGNSPLCIGQSALYTTTGNPGGTWSSSNTAVATVDASTGVVTAVGAGSTGITYSLTACGGGTLTDSQVLTVNPNVNPGTVSGNSPICTNTTALYSTNGDAGGTWSSSDPSVASVNAISGLVSAMAVGTTDITYTISSGCGSPASASKNLSVIPTVSAGTVSGNSPLCIGQSDLYTTDGNTGGTWSSSNTSVATVNATTGMVTAVAAGTTNITYSLTACGGGTLTASKTLTVSVNANAGTISGSATVCIGASVTYSSNGDAGGSWSSSDALIATVDASTGVVTGVASGTASITYTVTAGCNAPVSSSKVITVSVGVNPGTVSGASPLCIGATATYSVTGASAAGTWSSSNTSVATVNASTGLVTAVAAGTTSITYTVNVGCGAPASASAVLTVNANVTAGTVNGLSPICIGALIPYTSTGTSGGTWSSSNALVATVDASTGVVTGVAAGTATITYTVTTGCNSPKSASKTVTVSPNVSAGPVSGQSPLCIGFNAVYSSTGGTPGGTWSSSNTAVATVNTAGIVVAISAGTTDITYTVISGCGSPVSATKNLTVNANASAGTISGTSPLCVGATAAYTSSGTTGGNWSSSNTAVATVNASTGVVTAVAVGTTNITYTVSGCGGTLTASKTLTVSATLTAGTVNGNTPLCVGATASYTSTGSTGGTWSSSNTAVASVSATGLVTALGAGTTNITYTVNSCTGPVSSFKTLTVNPGYTITSSSGPNGTITPLGVTTVTCNGRQTYTIIPDNCYKIQDVIVDGVSATASVINGTYTFNNVNANHTISVTFTPAGPFTIALTATGSGTTVPVAPNTATVPCGGSQSYTFTANAGNHIGTVLIDGVNNPGAVSSGSYTFTNVQTNHTIQVNFVSNCTPPTVSINANSNPFCANLTLTANALPVGPAYTYQWYRNGVAITGATAQTLALTGNPGTGAYTVKASVSTCTSPFSAPYNYNSQNTLQSYTILGTDNVDLGENNIVLHGSVGNTKNNGQVSMKKGAWVASAGAFVRAKNINIQSPSNVPLKIFTPAVATLPAMLYNGTNPNSFANINIATNGTYNSNYKNVTVKTGVIATLTGSIFNNITIEKGAQVTFTSGTVNTGQLDVRDGGSSTNLTKVKFSNDCVVKTNGNVNIGKYCQVNPTSKFVVFYVNGNYTVDGKGTNVRTSVYAPQHNIQVKGDANVICYMTGRFIARQIQSNNKNVTWDNFDCANPPAPLPFYEAETSFAPGGITSSDGVEESIATRLDVKAYPNPSANSFNLKLTTTLLSEQVMIRITDVSGRVLQQLKGTPDQVFHVGDMLKAGIYFAELQQGSQKVSVKLIKQ